jgi:hypothetical protein
VDEVVARYLDCGVFEAGFARAQCRDCHAEYLVACSCKGRGLCPSCGAKRAAAFAAFLRDEVLEPVCHQMWTFTVPKMLRPYFLHHRGLLGRLCHAAWETVSELMAAAAAEADGFRTGMVVVAQTAGDALGLHPHLHALVPRGGWASDGTWVPVPYVNADAAERLFRHKVLSFLKDEGLLSEERLALLLSWQHHTGFSVDSSVKVEPEDGAGLERLARYIMRPPLSLERMHWTAGAREVAYTLKPAAGQSRAQENLDPLDFLARLLAHVPEPRLHLAHYYGWYSNVSRGRRRKGKDANLATTPSSCHEADGLSPAERRARRRRWAQLVRRVYEVDPLVCPKCGGEMRIISVILDPAVITSILEHLRRKKDTATRAPPIPTSSLEAAS